MAAAWDDVGNASSLELGVDAFELASMITRRVPEDERVVAGLLRRLQLLPRLRRQAPGDEGPAGAARRRAAPRVPARQVLRPRASGEELPLPADHGRPHRREAARHRGGDRPPHPHDQPRRHRPFRGTEEASIFLLLTSLLAVFFFYCKQGTDEVMELNSDAPTASPRLSFEEDPGSAAIPGLTPTGLLPGIEEFQIIGEPKLGSKLRACGFPINGTSSFQWVRYLDDGTRQSIEGATIYDYLVAVDDVDTVLGVECIPKDDNGLKGELVSAFSNGKRKIACDSVMQREIDVCISNREALFNVLIMSQVNCSDNWGPATLVLRRAGYEIKLERIDDVVIKENYSKNLQFWRCDCIMQHIWNSRVK